MARPVKPDEVEGGGPRRSYDASRRRNQARRNRARVVEAARRLFLADGYAATTLATIAADADVSVESIYKAFRNKAGLLKAVWDVEIAGDDEPVPIMERQWVAAIVAEPEPRRKLDRYAAQLSVSVPRTARIQLLVRTTAAFEPEVQAVWNVMQQERLVGMTAFAVHLAESGCLRDGVTAATARDVLWTYGAVDLYELLVLQREWDVVRYRDFLADALAAALLRQPDRSP